MMWGHLYLWTFVCTYYKQKIRYGCDSIESISNYMASPPCSFTLSLSQMDIDLSHAAVSSALPSKWPPIIYCTHIPMRTTIFCAIARRIQTKCMMQYLFVNASNRLCMPPHLINSCLKLEHKIWNALFRNELPVIHQTWMKLHYVSVTWVQCLLFGTAFSY